MAQWRGVDFMRLLVVIIFIITPIYFILLIYFVNSSGALVLNMEPFLSIGADITYYVIYPLCFSFTWWIFIYLLRNKIANSYENIKKETNPIPTRWLIFYGVNAFVMLAFFIIPFISSIMAIFGFFVLGWNVLVRSDWSFERGKAHVICYGIIIFGLFLTFPILVQIEFWNDYTAFWNLIWQSWKGLIPYLYSFSIVIVNALTIGGIIYFVYSGASEFERGAFGTTYDRAPRRAIILLEIILFVVFTIIWGFSIAIGGIFSWIYMIISLFCLFLAVLIFLISLFRSRTGGVRPSILGYIYTVLFMGVEGYRILTVAMDNIANIFDPEAGYPVELMTTTILIASIIFIIVFLVSIARAPDERSF